MAPAQPVNIMDLPDKLPPKEKPMTRQQRRFIQRIEQEAHQTFNNLAGKFLEFFTDADDPEGQDVADKMTQLSAQWKLYCHRKRLNPSAKEAMENYCKGVCEQYFKLKEARDERDDKQESINVPEGSGV